MNLSIYFLLLNFYILNIFFILVNSMTISKMETLQKFKRNVGNETQCKCKPKNLKIIGSNLFGNEPFLKKCFLNEEIALLAARREFEVIIPKNISMKFLTEEFVESIMKYFLESNQLILKISNNKTKTHANMAFYDTVGGYINSYFYPLAKESFYAGTLCRKTVQNIFNFLQECKIYLNTYGLGWSLEINDFSNISNEIENLQITFQKYNEDPCIHLILSDALLYQENLITYLPKLDNIRKINFENIEDEEFGTIWLPFTSKQYYNLKSDFSSFILIKYYVIVIKCYEYLDLSSKSFNENFQNWYEKNIVEHLNDEKIYPGLGASLRILKTIKNLKNDSVNLMKNDKNLNINIDINKNYNQIDNNQIDKYVHYNLRTFENHNQDFKNNFNNNLKRKSNLFNKIKKEDTKSKRQKENEDDDDEDDENCEGNDCYKNNKNSRDVDDSNYDDDDDDDNDEDKKKFKKIKYMIITFVVISVLFLIIVLFVVIKNFSKGKLKNIFKRKKKKEKKIKEKENKKSICENCDNKSKQEDEIIVRSDSPSVIPSEDEKQIPPPPQKPPQKRCKCCSRKPKPKQSPQKPKPISSSESLASPIKHSLASPIKHSSIRRSKEPTPVTAAIDASAAIRRSKEPTPVTAAIDAAAAAIQKPKSKEPFPVTIMATAAVIQNNNETPLSSVPSSPRNQLKENNLKEISYNNENVASYEIKQNKKGLQSPREKQNDNIANVTFIDELSSKNESKKGLLQKFSKRHKNNDDTNLCNNTPRQSKLPRLKLPQNSPTRNLPKGNEKRKNPENSNEDSEIQTSHSWETIDIS